MKKTMQRLVLTLISLLMLGLSGGVYAIQGSALTPGQYKALNDIQEALSEKDFVQAQERLDKFTQKLEPSFALALAYQLYGQLYLMQEKTEKSLAYFEKTLALNVLEPAQEVGIATTSAQILLSLDRAADASRDLEPRLTKLLNKEQELRKSHKHKRRGGRGHEDHDHEKQFEIVSPQSMATLATACHLQRDYKKSIPWLKHALKRSQSPQENWLLMLMVAYYQEKNYLAAAEVLDDLQRVNPSKEEYWVQQAAMYQMVEKPALALRSLELGYGAGYVEKPSNIMQLIQLLISQGMPERGARILQKHMNDKTLELTDSNWRLLAGAWLQSRERQHAAHTLRLANAHLNDGVLLFRAAQLQAQDGAYQGALNDAQAALSKGLEDKEKSKALMLAANSAYELKDLATARRYFQQALAFSDTASNAKSWLDYIGNLEQYAAAF